MSKLAWLTLLLGALCASARYIEEMKHGFVIPCEGGLCYETLFCWRGARLADLNQATYRVAANVTFNDERDTCIDLESDDVLSMRAFVFGNENETAATRLSNRIGHERGWISSMVLDALLGKHKMTGDGECHGKQCTVQFSPYGLSCIRLCAPMRSDGHPIKAEVTFRSESVLDARTVYLWVIGFALAAAAPSLAERPEMFYLTGGSLGVMFAVALLVLIISRLVTRSGPTKSQLGVAAFLQVGVVYLRKAIYDFVKTYIDWIALYVVVTFVSSLGLVHYFLKGDNGRVHLSSSLKDIVRIALQLLGAFFIAMPIPSARFRLITLAVVFGFETISSFRRGGLVNLFFGWDAPPPTVKEEDESYEEEPRTPGHIEAPAAPPPSKSLSGSKYLTQEEYDALGRDYTDRELKKLLTPSKSASKKEQEVLSWLQQNHSRLFVRRDDDEEEEELEVDE